MKHSIKSIFSGLKAMAFGAMIAISTPSFSANDTLNKYIEEVESSVSQKLEDLKTGKFKVTNTSDKYNFESSERFLKLAQLYDNSKTIEEKKIVAKMIMLYTIDGYDVSAAINSSGATILDFLAIRLNNDSIYNLSESYGALKEKMINDINNAKTKDEKRIILLNKITKIMSSNIFDYTKSYDEKVEREHFEKMFELIDQDKKITLTTIK